MRPHVIGKDGKWLCVWTGQAGSLVATGATPGEAVDSWWAHYGEVKEVVEQVRAYRGSLVSNRVWDWDAGAPGHPAWN